MSIGSILGACLLSITTGYLVAAAMSGRMDAGLGPGRTALVADAGLHGGPIVALSTRDRTRWLVLAPRQ